MPRGFMYADSTEVYQDGHLSGRLMDLLRNRSLRARHRGGSTEVRFQLNGGEMAGYSPTVYEIVEGEVGLRAEQGSQSFESEADFSGLPVIDLG